MRALHRVLQHAMRVHRAALQVARTPNLHHVAHHQTITASTRCTAHTALFSKAALSAIAAHTGRISTQTAAHATLSKCSIHTTPHTARSVLRFSQLRFSQQPTRMQHTGACVDLLCSYTGPDNVVYGLIGANLAVFLLWKVSPGIATKHFLLVGA